MPQMIISKSMVPQVRRMAEEGALQTEAADELGCSLRALQRACYRYAIKFKGKGRGHYNPAKTSMILTLISSRKATNSTAIARLINRSDVSVGRTVRRLIRQGLVKSKGYGRHTVLSVTGKWTDAD